MFEFQGIFLFLYSDVIVQHLTGIGFLFKFLQNKIINNACIIMTQTAWVYEQQSCHTLSTT